MLLITSPSSFGIVTNGARKFCFGRSASCFYSPKYSATISSIAFPTSCCCGVKGSLFGPMPKTKHLNNRQKQQFSSSWLAVKDSISIWGGCGWLITTLHMGGVVPYWVCMSLSSLMVRTCLLPLVVQSAHTQAKFASIAPDIQFVITLFQQDRQMMKLDQRTQTNPMEMKLLKRQHFQATWRNLRYIYQSNNVHPLDIFKVKPLVQRYFFYRPLLLGLLTLPALFYLSFPSRRRCCRYHFSFILHRTYNELFEERTLANWN